MRSQLLTPPGALARTLLVLVAIGFAACSRGPRLPHLAPEAKILAFGDSLTYGTGATEGHSYPAELAAILQRRVINAGVPGETTAEGRARLAATLDEQQPALVILCMGGNDMLRQLDRGEMRANLAAMIEDVQRRHIALVLLGVPEPKLLGLRSAPVYAELAKQYRLPFDAETWPDVLGNRSLKSDEIHANDAGYRVVAEAVAKLLHEAGAT